MSLKIYDDDNNKAKEKKKKKNNTRTLPHPACHMENVCNLTLNSLTGKVKEAKTTRENAERRRNVECGLE